MMILDMVVITIAFITIVIAMIIGAMVVIIPTLIGIQHWLFDLIDRKFK